MREEILNPINQLIYYGFFYKQDGDYIDDIMESLKEEIERKINKKIDWEEIDCERLESDVTEQHYDLYYTEKELFNILKTIKLNSSDIEDIKINLDIEDYKKRVINSFFNDDTYLHYLNNKRIINPKKKG